MPHKLSELQEGILSRLADGWVMRWPYGNLHGRIYLSKEGDHPMIGVARGTFYALERRGYLEQITNDHYAAEYALSEVGRKALEEANHDQTD